MHSSEAKTRFEAFLASRGEVVALLTPRRGIEAMLAFYGDVRAMDCDLDNDGDMLLFQWGTYDVGSGVHFRVDITRQFIGQGAEDDDIWQLHLTFELDPTDEHAALGSGDRWCHSPSELGDFASHVRSHPAIASVGARSDALITMDYECAG